MKGIDDTGTYSIVDGKIIFDVDVKGNLPDSGTININDKCEVEILDYEENMCAYKAYTSDKAVIGRIINSECIIDDNKTLINTQPTEESCFTFDSATGTITDYDFNNNKCLGTVIIPEKINNVNVTKIADGVFVDGYDYLLSYNMYTGFDTLNSAYTKSARPNMVYPVKDLDTSLTKKCFTSSTDTTGVVKPFDFVGTNGEYYACTINDMTKESIKDSIVTTTKIKAIDFSHAIHLTKIGIGISAYGSVSKVTFGNLSSLTNLGQGAFTNNNIKGTIDMSGLTSLTVINDDIFNNNQLEGVVLNDKIESIWPYAFRNNNIKNIDLPSALTIIFQYSFENNDIRNLVIPDNVDQISEGAFYKNENMETLVLGTKVNFIDSISFEYCGLNSVTSKATNLEYIRHYAFADNNLTTLNFPSMQYLYEKAFANNDLRTITIPSTIKGINETAFANNPNLTSITINKASLTYAPWGAPSTCIITYNG